MLQHQVVVGRLILVNEFSFIQGHAQPQTLQSFGPQLFTKTYSAQVQFLQNTDWL